MRKHLRVTEDSETISLSLETSETYIFSRLKEAFFNKKIKIIFCD